MTTTQKAVISLMKAAVTCSPQSLPDDFDIGEAEDIIRRHHVHALAYDGAIRCGVDKNHPFMQKLFANYCQSLLKSEGQLREVDRICKAFEENGIDYMLLKGCKMKKLYPKPELRAMGDADILIHIEQYDKIHTIMESVGFQYKDLYDNVYTWTSCSLLLELHYSIVPQGEKDFYAWFGNGWQFAKGDGCCHCMSPEVETVFLFSHFAKHFRAAGIGCRHVLDLWVWQRNNPAMDTALLEKMLSEMKLDKFYSVINMLLHYWFEDGKTEPWLEIISDYLFDCGSFGNKSTEVRADIARYGDSGTKFKHALLKIFPSAKTLQWKYPILQKAPWLLPFIWVLRLFTKVTKERKRTKLFVDSLVSLNDEASEEFRQMLKYLEIESEI